VIPKPRGGPEAIPSTSNQNPEKVKEETRKMLQEKLEREQQKLREQGSSISEHRSFQFQHCDQ